MTRPFRMLAVPIAVALLVGSGCSAGGDDSAANWEQRRGSDWSEYDSAFRASWRTGCERASEIGHDLVKKTIEERHLPTTVTQMFTPPVCDPAASPDDPPDLAPLDPAAAGRVDGFVAGLALGCGALRGTDRDDCIALGGET
jgi:hypothetical protein